VKLSVLKDSLSMGAAAAAEVAGRLNAAISARGAAALLLSTGASQFDTLAALVAQPVDWGRVSMYHLDEYIGIGESHPASFVRYLKERFISKVSLKEYTLIDGMEDPTAMLARLNMEMSGIVVDVGVIGIGENAHIAFNDPPADFGAESPFHIVRLSERCKMQQVGEGWFQSAEEVPERAISITCKQIMKCRFIASPVPHAAKAVAVRDMMSAGAPDPMIPATLLLQHTDWHLFLDEASAALSPR
jgi:glucosamine-6-phosphate deaminase